MYVKKIARINRTPMKDITNRNQGGELGGKRKMETVWLEVEPTEKDTAEGPRLKALKMEANYTEFDEEMEANSKMPSMVK